MEGVLRGYGQGQGERGESQRTTEMGGKREQGGSFRERALCGRTGAGAARALNNASNNV
jgi:hypothetical protein